SHHLSTLPSSHCILFNNLLTTHIHTLSLHDALPILQYTTLPLSIVLMKGYIITISLYENLNIEDMATGKVKGIHTEMKTRFLLKDRKSTRLNSSHVSTSYPVFCLKKNNRKCQDKK